MLWPRVEENTDLQEVLELSSVRKGPTYQGSRIGNYTNGGDPKLDAEKGSPANYIRGYLDSSVHSDGNPLAK